MCFRIWFARFLLRIFVSVLISSIEPSIEQYWEKSIELFLYHPFLVLVSVYVLVAQSCLTLCDPMDCGPPGSSVHGILQARILGWVAISFSRGSSQFRHQTGVSCIAGRFFTSEPPRESLVKSVWSWPSKIVLGVSPSLSHFRRAWEGLL